MAFLDSLLNQKCVYWPKGSVNLHGKYSAGTAVERSCRWEDKQQEAVKEDGTIFISTSTVYLDADVEVGGWLWLGELADAPDTPPAKGEIKSVGSVPDLDDNSLQLYMAMT